MPVHATPVGYTDRAAFEAAVNALGGTAATVDVDDLVDGTPIPSGTALHDWILLYDFGDVQVEVREAFDPSTLATTSPPNLLGSDDAGILQDGDNIELLSNVFINAIGLSLTTSDTLFSNDIVLSANGLDVGLDPGAVQSTLTDGARVYFCVTNVLDLGVLKAAFFATPPSPNWNPDADFTEDGAINALDLGIMRLTFFGQPGPSGLPNPCDATQSTFSIECKQDEQQSN